MRCTSPTALLCSQPLRADRRPPDSWHTACLALAAVCPRIVADSRALPPHSRPHTAALTWNTAGFLINLSVPLNVPITDLSQNHIRFDNGNALLSHMTVDATNLVGDDFMVDITGVRASIRLPVLLLSSRAHLCGI